MYNYFQQLINNSFPYTEPHRLFDSIDLLNYQFFFYSPKISNQNYYKKIKKNILFSNNHQ